jgi:hypothetical protein
MGASTWIYFVPFCEDAIGAFVELQKEVRQRGDFYRPHQLSLIYPSPASFDQLGGDRMIAIDGTHSILDMTGVIAPESPDRHGAVRILSAKELVELFGTTHPDRQGLDRLANSGALYTGCPRGSGRCAPIYEGNTPAELAFWGISGD